MKLYIKQFVARKTKDQHAIRAFANFSYLWYVHYLSTKVLFGIHIRYRVLTVYREYRKGFSGTLVKNLTLKTVPTITQIF